jgi:hypothetical protein
VKAACKRLKDEADLHQETFETEKASWLDEKEKVIRYQKQLQLNYVQVQFSFCLVVPTYIKISKTPLIDLLFH